MGFNKRIVTLENIKEFLKNEYSLSKVFSADALIFTDDASTKIFKLYEKGVEDKEILKMIENGEIV
jgi:hypothetical protein